MFFYNDRFGIKYPTKVNIPLNKETNQWKNYIYIYAVIYIYFNCYLVYNNRQCSLYAAILNYDFKRGICSLRHCIINRLTRCHICKLSKPTRTRFKKLCLFLQITRKDTFDWIYLLVKNLQSRYSQKVLRLNSNKKAKTEMFDNFQIPATFSSGWTSKIPLDMIGCCVVVFLI